jgi:leucyl/phenylalanyl-tRNA---protein transferase
MSSNRKAGLPLPWLMVGQAFPPVNEAWGPGSEASGLLAAGADLSPETLVKAYQHGIYPWFNVGEPPLWWCPDPRMVLDVADFRLHRSLRQSIARFRASADVSLRVDTQFEAVMQACAQSARQGKNVGSWIQPKLIEGYTALHRQGLAHSFEVWHKDALVAGLYCVAIGKAVFGESMFTLVNDGSKVALAALVAFCRHHDIERIDCQQQTAHLGFMGAHTVAREAFCKGVARAVQYPAPTWDFKNAYWDALRRNSE